MATTDLIGAPERADHPTPTPPTPTASFHFAAMRRYENAARSLSVRLSVGSIPAGEKEAAKEQRQAYHLLASAHRSAARKRVRAEKFWASRPGTGLRIAVRGVRRVQLAVTA